jgi:formate/nitrite transporter FocA (FNT family)
MDADPGPEADAAEAAEAEASKAGAESPHLDEAERTQAAAHAAPHAIVIHEVIRAEGEAELARRAGALAWSGLAAGLSMGFSFLTLAMVQSALPDAPWRRLLDSAGYCVGFVIVILGRQQLFTESTLTAVLPLLLRRNWPTFAALLRLWGIVLAGNLVGTWIFAGLISPSGLFTPAVRAALLETGHATVEGAFAPTLLKAMLAGWLIALMVWLLPSARSARMLVIVLITYVVSVGRFSHTIAGSVEAAFTVLNGHATIGDYLWRFLAPTLLGNTLGGVALVALLNHAPLASDMAVQPD